MTLSRLKDDDLRLMLLIRHFELALLDLFGQGVLAGTTHTCLGQEPIPVAMRALLDEDDFVFSNHRGHGHYLARFDDPCDLLAEVMGRSGAVCAGVGGSQHLLRDRFLSTGVQGESLPVAVGTALHQRNAGRGGLALAYIGDGTWGEGAVYEALNIAALHRLPLVVLVEHNGIAQTTPTRVQMSGNIAGRAAAFGIAHHRTDADDVTRIRAEVAGLIAAARAGDGPLVLELITARVGPHSKGDDVRSDEERRIAACRDWYPRYARTHPEQFGRLDSEQRERVAAVVEEVTARPRSAWAAT